MAKAKSIAGGALQGAGTGAMIGATVGGPVGLAIGAGVGALGSGLLTELMGDGSEYSEQEQAAREAALNDILSIPSPQLQQIKLNQYISQGTFKPEEETAIKLADSEMKGIKVDPVMKEAQMEALQSLRDVGRLGLRPEDRLALEEIQGKQIRDAQASQQAAIQSRQMRGIAGSGDELAAALSGGQAAAQSGRMAGLQVGAQAQRAALEAMAGAGSLGGQIRSQEFGEQSDVARAQDQINRFNTDNQQNIQARNIAAKNAAQLHNLTQAQKLSDANTELSNQQNAFNNFTLPQQQFSNQMRQGEAKSAARTGMGNYLGNRASNEAQSTQNTLQGLGQAGLAGAQMHQTAKLQDAQIAHLQANTPKVAPGKKLLDIDRKTGKPIYEE